MASIFLEKLKDETKAFIVAPIYPFLQKDWLLKMWVFVALSYVPIVNVIIARGWRLEYIRRLGWREKRVLPNPAHAVSFFINGVKLWIARGIFAVVPVTVIIMVTGVGGVIDLWNDTVYLFELNVDFLVRRIIPFKQYASESGTFFWNEWIDSLWALLIENVWLVIYVPLYRIGTIRYALTGKLRRSHMAIKKNLRFLFRNLLEIVLMYAFNLFNFVLVLVVDFILALTVVGVPLIPILTFYMSFWNTGYEYGLIARTMVEQEQLQAPKPHQP